MRENKIDFNELVVVTLHTVSSEARIRMKRNARADYGVSLDIYERKTLGIRLTDLSNGIFSRHFPDIRAQRKDVARAASRGALPEAALERALLQASLALTFRPESQRARKSVFDYFVLALILAESNQQLTIQNAAAKATTALKSNREVPMEQVAAAIGRLEKRRLAETSKGFVCPTEVALAEVAVVL